GLMNGDRATAPTRPPPGPYRPGSLTFGWDGSVKPRLSFSPQQAEASVSSADSSNVMKPSPPCRYAGEPMMRGTQVARNQSTWPRPPLAPSWHVGVSWPSAQVSGVIQE